MNTFWRVYGRVEAKLRTLGNGLGQTCREAAPAHDSSHAALCLLLLARVQKNPTHGPIWVELTVILTRL